MSAKNAQYLQEMENKENGAMMPIILRSVLLLRQRHFARLRLKTHGTRHIYFMTDFDEQPHQQPNLALSRNAVQHYII